MPSSTSRQDPVTTPHGVVYPPASTAVQVLTLVTTFGASFGLGALTVAMLGLEPLGARAFAHGAFLLTLFFGYALWAARLRALAFHFIGKNLLRALIVMLVRRRRPQRLEDVLPTKEKLAEMMARAQRASFSFTLVSLPIGCLAGMGVALIETHPRGGTHGTVLGALCVLWGLLLSVMGRRGFLPMSDGADSG